MMSRKSGQARAGIGSCGSLGHSVVQSRRMAKQKCLSSRMCFACSLTQLSRLSARADEHIDAVAGHGHQTHAALLILLQTTIAAHTHRSRAMACAPVSERHRIVASTNIAGDLCLCGLNCSYLQFCVGEISGRLVLRSETRRRIVAVASELAVVNTDQAQYTHTRICTCIGTCSTGIPCTTRRQKKMWVSEWRKDLRSQIRLPSSRQSVCRICVSHAIMTASSGMVRKGDEGGSSRRVFGGRWFGVRWDGSGGGGQPSEAGQTERRRLDDRPAQSASTHQHAQAAAAAPVPLPPHTRRPPIGHQAGAGRQTTSDNRRDSTAFSLLFLPNRE